MNGKCDSSGLGIGPPLAGSLLDGVVSFVVFRFPPLKLLVHFVLRKGVFGVSVTDASIHQNLLVVMHSDGQIKAYSLEYILEKVSLERQSIVSMRLSLSELIGSLKLGSVWAFVQLIFCSRWPMNQLNKNPNIA